MYNYKRRETKEIKVGTLGIGGNNPIRIQTMANTDTNDIEESIAQAKRCINAGTELLRYTTQGTKEALNLGKIRQKLNSEGICIPLVADIHFNANVAEVAAKEVEKVRINPGNFVPGKSGDYTDEEWHNELNTIKDKLHNLLSICKDKGTAIRIGVNHGSLSPRIMSRYGNTPIGLATSCMEFIEMCEEEGFYNLILSVKASNTRVMIYAVRLLVDMMDAKGKNYPIHLGVTEAGSDDEGRIKSAVGIGTLLNEGIGDTIRVSLSEAPEAEVPVAKKLADYITEHSASNIIYKESGNKAKTEYSRRESVAINNIGGNNKIAVIADKESSCELKPDFKADSLNFVKVNGENVERIANELKNSKGIILLESDNKNFVGEMRYTIDKLDEYGIKNPVIAKREYHTDDIETLEVHSASDLGPLLIDGLIDGIWLSVKSEKISQDKITDIAFEILQSSRSRISKTEYTSCPSCGRTKYDLPKVVRQVKEATQGFAGIKIAIMGCIVNGPGEMADADFGYIGAGLGKVSLFKGKECVMRNIPEEEAIDRLLELIRSTQAERN